MWKTKFLFRTEDEQFEALVNPMHIREAAAVALTQHGVKFMEVADAKTGERRTASSTSFARTMQTTIPILHIVLRLASLAT